MTYSHLRTFGYLSYILVESDDKNKLQIKSRKCVFIGYGDAQMGYWYWDPVNRKVFHSHNITFNEKVVYGDATADIEKSTKKTSSNDDTGDEVVDVDTTIPDDHIVTVEDNEVGEDIAESLDTSSGSDSEDDVGANGDSEDLNTSIALRKAKCVRGRPARYLNYLFLTDSSEPENHEEDLKTAYSLKWEQAMQEEMNSLHLNGTCSLTRIPKKKKVLQNR